MSNIEQRLRSALNARADLVHPEDLTTLGPVFEPPVVDESPWWQKPGSYLFVAAVAIIVIALPLLALASTGGDRNGQPDRDDVATSPTGDATVTDPLPVPVDSRKGDVDGDGEPDQIDVVRTETDEGGELVTIEVALSSTGTTVDHLAPRPGDVRLAEVADVDGRRGQEVLVVAGPAARDLHRIRPIVLSLRDGALTDILAADLGSGSWTGYWWVNTEQDELWWWLGGHTGDDEVGPLDVVRFPHGDRLQAADAGRWCVVPSEPTRLLDCDREPDKTDEPDADPSGDPQGDPVDTWWDDPVAGLPTTWGVEGGSVGLAPTDIDGDGDGGDTATVSGGDLVVTTAAGESRLPISRPGLQHLEGVVELSGQATPVILVSSTEQGAGSTYSAWLAFTFVDGELVQLTTAPLAPSLASDYSNLPPSDGGHPKVRTWLVGDNGLFGMDFEERAQVDGPDGEQVWAYRVRLRSWYVDGRTIRATTLGWGCAAPQIGMQISRCPAGI